MDVHPTGRLMLSTGQDRTLRLWDLVHGRGGYVKALPAVASLVRFSTDGSRFALVMNDSITVFDASNGKVRALRLLACAAPHLLACRSCALCTIAAGCTR